MTPDQRHLAMAHNHGRTGPERALASALWQLGLRYLTAAGYKARYGRHLAGNPDLVFPRKRIVVFLDGCFWHGCPECRRIPDGYDSAWTTKIARTVERDLRITEQLHSEGWQVLRIPEHAVRTKVRLAETAKTLACQLAQIAPQ